MVRPSSVARRWGTWHPGYPTALSDVSSGLQLRLAAYSGRAGAVIDFAGAAGVVFGTHRLDSGYVELDLAVGDSRFRLEWAKPTDDPTVVIGRTTLVEAAELKLRLWSLLIVEVDRAAGRLADAALAPVPARPAGFDEAPLLIQARARSEHLALVTDPEPPICGGYASATDAFDELEREGYVPPARDVPSTPGAAVARFNHEAVSVVRFAAALATDPETAATKARMALAEADGTIDAAVSVSRTEHEGPESRNHDGRAVARSAEAIRDVVAWNTCYDPENVRWYTGPSRRWAAAKFGGWLVWQTDVLYNALLAATLGDAELTTANLDAVLHGAQPAGNLPCLLSQRSEWVDRAHPPIAAWVVWSCAARLGDRSLPARHFDTLLRAHRWWDDARSAGAGLVTYGTSPTGRGLYAGTELAARNESSMDNSPMFDGVSLTDDARVLNMTEVGVNALHVLDAEVLASMARELGRTEEAEALTAAAEARAEAVRLHLWDPQRRVFAGRWRDGGFVESLTPTSFFPLLAGIPDPDQARALVDEHIRDPAAFWGAPALPANALYEPATNERSYWRGRVWPPLSYLVHVGLHRSGQRTTAAELAHGASELFHRLWRNDRVALESYHIAADGQHRHPDVDDFYGWAALLPLLALLEAGDVTPWDGVRVGPGTGEVLLDGRWWGVATDRDLVRLRPPGGGELRAEGVRYLTHVRIEARVVAATVPAATVPIRVTWSPAPLGVLAGLVDGVATNIETVDDAATLVIPPRPEPAHVELVRA
ncbi:hypothetical protein ER308_07920 [Egibacter rhizosphaerae]|uniref:Mannosylglycerate hydrolase MGH1-like glycoside hydrolase domain-containing protein n=1 Tax=Egibacter rhizosphaerae TaxID=1670831 RepID=A0A411YE68_9ACTN|nr:trehalase family glycosidase [Egibacter rhizosphaerae]QBI19486.1 hypothetical protein ER308_07920 [Egibacter rhizosphaerae]